MKFATLFAFLVAAVHGSPESNNVRDLQTLEAKWALDALVFDETDGVMTLTANSPGGGDGTTSPIIHVFSKQSATDNGNAAQACRSVQSPSNLDLLLEIKNKNGVVAAVDLPASTNGLDTTALTMATTGSVWSFEISTGIEGTSAYKAAAGLQTASIYFCVLYGIRQSDTAIGNDIITYREMAVTVDVTLNGAFVIDRSSLIQVTALPIQTDEAATEYGVFAEICEGTLTTPLVQVGTAFPLCVCVDNYPLSKVTSFETLSLREYDGSFTMNTIVGGVPTATHADVTEELPCGVAASSASKHCCRVDTMLTFYINDQISNPTYLGAYGVVNLELAPNRRSLSSGSERDLQEGTKVQESYEMNFVAVPEPTASGAVAKGIVAGAAAVGAALLI